MVLFTQCIFIKLYPVHVIKNLYQIFLSTKPLLKNVGATSKGEWGRTACWVRFFNILFCLFSFLLIIFAHWNAEQG